LHLNQVFKIEIVVRLLGFYLSKARHMPWRCGKANISGATKSALVGFCTTYAGFQSDNPGPIIS